MREWSGVLDVDSVWDTLEPLVEKACIRGGNKYTPDHILRAIKRKDFQLWVGKDDGKITAGAITEIVCHPCKKEARIIFGMGRNPHDIFGFIEIFGAWAKAHGCDTLKAEMRIGFEKPFREAGWERTHTTMELELNYA